MKLGIQRRNVWQAEFKLMLYPSDSSYLYDGDKMVYFLKSKELIENNIGGNRYSTGSQFVSLLTFMGCSPDIELEPQNNKPYCYVELETRDKPEFVSGSNLKKSRCTHCKKEITTPFICPHCQQAHKPEKINWRKTAFLAQSWITIGNIYELEAIPSDLFLDALEKETGTKWKPAYIRFRD